MQLKEGFAWGTIKSELHGEVAVGLYCGVPRLIQAKAGSPSYRVEVHPAIAKFTGKGYVHINSSLFKILEKAVEKEERIIVRFEKQRKKGVDINIPIAEISSEISIAQKNINLSCVGIFNPKTKKWILDQNYGDPAKDTVEVKSKLQEILAGEEGEVDPDEFFAAPEVKVANPLSFDKQQHLITMYYFIMGREQKYGVSLKDNVRESMARDLLALTDSIQKLIKEADVVDYKDYSHTRARYMLFTYEELVRNLDKEGLSDFNNWKAGAYESAKAVLQWAKS